MDSKIKLSFKQQCGLIAIVSVKIKSNRSCTKTQTDLFCTQSETCTRELWGLSGAKLSKTVKDSILDQENNVRISCKWPFVAINRP